MRCKHNKSERPAWICDISWNRTSTVRKLIKLGFPFSCLKNLIFPTVQSCTHAQLNSMQNICSSSSRYENKVFRRLLCGHSGELFLRPDVVKQKRRRGIFLHQSLSILSQMSLGFILKNFLRSATLQHATLTFNRFSLLLQQEADLLKVPKVLLDTKNDAERFQMVPRLMLSHHLHWENHDIAKDEDDLPHFDHLDDYHPTR